MIYLGTFEKKDKFYFQKDLLDRLIAYLKMVGFKNVTNIIGSMIWDNTKKQTNKKDIKEEEEAFRRMLFGKK
jgi:hypothetical protein